MEPGSIKRNSLPVGVTALLAALLIAVIVGAGLLVAGALRFFMFPLSLPLTAAIVTLSIAAWLGRLVWQAVSSMSRGDR